MATVDLKSLREKYGISANKRLGQHFLFDQNLTDKIAKLAGSLKESHVIEIGPGPGCLTLSILEAGAASLHAIEIDSKCYDLLEELGSHFPSKFHLIRQDALGLSLAEVVPSPRKIIANLPYNVSTEILMRLVPTIEKFENCILMFQKEVADRICAAPGTSSYGRLSVLVQYKAAVERLLHVPKQAFSPPPKVESTVIGLYPRVHSETCNYEALSYVTRAAFAQRRKMLRVVLKSLGIPTLENWLEHLKISPQSRPQDLDVAAYVRMANAWEKFNKGE